MNLGNYLTSEVKLKYSITFGNWYYIKLLRAHPRLPTKEKEDRDMESKNYQKSGKKDSPIP
ncbi:MAG: hypothetical protein AB4080_03945 [Trichodesmium sp.]